MYDYICSNEWILFLQFQVAEHQGALSTFLFSGGGGWKDLRHRTTRGFWYSTGHAGVHGRQKCIRAYQEADKIQFMFMSANVS